MNCSFASPFIHLRHIHFSSSIFFYRPKPRVKSSGRFCLKTFARPHSQHIGPDKLLMGFVVSHIKASTSKSHTLQRFLSLIFLSPYTSSMLVSAVHCPSFQRAFLPAVRDSGSICCLLLFFLSAFKKFFIVCCTYCTSMYRLQSTHPHVIMKPN